MIQNSSIGPGGTRTHHTDLTYYKNYKSPALPHELQVHFQGFLPTLLYLTIFKYFYKNFGIKKELY